MLCAVMICIMLCIGYEEFSDQCGTIRNEVAMTEIRCGINFRLSRINL
jgi:hypothetical protein